MNALTMPFRQLMERKLWPLAVLLVAAVAAVPMLLAKDDVAAPAPPVPSGAATTAIAQAPTQPIVTLGDPGEREAVRKVLGASKNPFEPAVKAKKADTATSTTTGSSAITPAASPGGDATSVGGPSTGTTTPIPGVVAPTPVKKKTYELWALKIRFGSTESTDLANRSIKRLAALPRMSEPALIYLGMKDDLRTAVFLVDANAMVVGDGRCVPSPTNCQNLELKKGQTAFIDVLQDGSSVAQYQLDFVRVLRTRTTDADAARRARRTIAKGGRDALRARVSRINGWVYDRETGVLIEPRD